MAHVCCVDAFVVTYVVVVLVGLAGPVEHVGHDPRLVRPRAWQFSMLFAPARRSLIADPHAHGGTLTENFVGRLIGKYGR